MGCGSSVVCSSSDAVRPQPGPPEPRIMKAQALYQQKKVEEALRELDRAIAEWPECARAYVERGRIKVESNQHDSALADFAAAIKIQPDYLMALHMRSHTHLHLGNLEEATADYVKAIKLDPDNGQLRALKQKIKRAVDEKRSQGAGGKAGAGAAAAGAGGRGGAGGGRANAPASSTATSGATGRAATNAAAGAGPGAGLGGGRPSSMILEPSASFHSVLGGGGPRITASPRTAESDDPFSGLDTPTSTRGGGLAGRRKLCMVCMDRERGCRLRPCLHAALCVDCAEGLKARHYTCPICSMRIESVEAGIFAQTFTTEDMNMSGLAALAAGLRMVGAASSPTGAAGAMVGSGGGAGAGVTALAVGNLPTTPSGTMRSARAGPGGTGLPQLAEEGEVDGDGEGEGEGEGQGEARGRHGEGQAAGTGAGARVGSGGSTSAPPADGGTPRAAAAAGPEGAGPEGSRVSGTGVAESVEPLFARVSSAGATVGSFASYATTVTTAL